MIQGFAARSLFFIRIFLSCLEIMGSSCASHNGNEECLLQVVSLSHEEDQVSVPSLLLCPVIPLIGNETVHIDHSSSLSVEEQYKELCGVQRRQLVERFCQLVGIYRQRFYEKLDQYNRSISGISSYDFLETSCDIERAANLKVMSYFPGDGVYVQLVSRPHPLNPNACIGVHGKKIELYPLYLNVDPAVQVAELSKIIQNIKTRDESLVSCMNFFLRVSQIDPNAYNAADDMIRMTARFCSTVAQIKAFFEEDTSVREVLAQSYDAPIDYMQELIGHMQQEKSFFQARIVLSNIERLGLAVRRNSTVVEQYEGIPTPLAIQAIVARSQHGLRQRDELKNARKRQFLLEQEQELARKNILASKQLRAKKSRGEPRTAIKKR